MLNTGSPYQNTRPEVKYVGDAACIRCHAEIGESYRAHPMGRSLSPITPETAPRVENTPAPHSLKPTDCNTPLRIGVVTSSISRRNAPLGWDCRSEYGGGSVHARVRETSMAYLIERDGFLFQSPITRYVRSERWDLSPGYEKKNLHFERPVLAGCLYCHGNRVENVAGTVNRYEQPIFRGYAIGCERCHGPGNFESSGPRWSMAATSRLSTPAPSSPRCVTRSASNVT